MKHLLYFSIAIFIVGASFTKDKDHNLNELKTLTLAGGENPFLPEITFDYRVSRIPSSLTNDPSYDTQSGEQSLVSIDNDVATLGRVLFYDENLSETISISCASCHAQKNSFTDGLEFSEGVDEPTMRNSLHLNDIGWFNQEFFWDASIKSLEELIANPLRNENEIGIMNTHDLIDRLNGLDYYPKLFKSAYGSADVTEDRIISALADFMRSMNTFNSKFDRVKSGFGEQFTSEEQVGEQLFEQDCKSCHTNERIVSDFIEIEPEGNDIMIDDIGVFAFKFNNGLEIDEDDKGLGEKYGEQFDGLFKPPTIRNASFTAPYMHDGRFATIEEVVDHYSENVIENEWSDPDILPAGGFKYTEKEKTALIAFLKTFDDHNFVTNIKWSDPFDPAAQRLNLTKDLTVLVSPNPATSQSLITILDGTSRADFTAGQIIDFIDPFDFGFTPGREEKEIHIVDLTGKQVHFEKRAGQVIELQVPDNIGSGTYIVTVRKGLEARSFKFVME